MGQEKNFLITGATGFIGRNLCKTLIKAGFNVRAITRKRDKELEDIGVEVRTGDFKNKGFIKSSFKSIDVVVHCAGNAKFGNGKSYKEDNLNLTQSLIKLSDNANEGMLFIFISTIGAVDRSIKDNCQNPLDETSKPNPKSDYGKSKIKAEDYLKESGKKYLIIRPSMVIGSDMRIDSHFSLFSRKLAKGSIFTRFAWPGSFSVIDVQDLSNAILHLVTQTSSINETYFCSGETITLKDFFNLHSKKLRINSSLILLATKPIAKFLPFQLKSLILPALTATDSKLRKTGWEPKKSINESLQEILHREISRIDPFIKVRGKTVITGAASGLGRSLAFLLSKEREKLLLLDKDRSALENLKNDISNCEIYPIDLSNEESLSELLNSKEWNEPISEIFSCAGIGNRGSIYEIEISKHLNMFKVNVLARLYLAKSLLERMKKQKFGRIILISSSSAFQAMPFISTYAATNSALLSLGESLAEEESNGEVQVMTVCPGGMQTNFQKSGGVKEISGEKLMSPEIVADKILKGLKKDKRVLIISLRSKAMSLISRLIPRFISNKVWAYLTLKLR